MLFPLLGSFGATPIPVLDYCREMSLLCEQRPDLFYRFTYVPILARARERVAKLIGAETDEVVVVPNATHGINTVIYNLDWKEGDILVNCMHSHSFDESGLNIYRLQSRQPMARLVG